MASPVTEPKQTSAPVCPERYGRPGRPLPLTSAGEAAQLLAATAGSRRITMSQSPYADPL